MAELLVDFLSIIFLKLIIIGGISSKSSENSR